MSVGDEEATKEMDGDEERPGNIDASKPWTPQLDFDKGGIKMKTGGEEIVVCRSGITVPDHLYLSDEEQEILQILEQRLRESIPRGHAERRDNASATHKE